MCLVTHTPHRSSATASAASTQVTGGRPRGVTGIASDFTGTAAAADGVRVLVDRLWPRGLAKDRARLHSWCRDIAPSDALRRWYHADATRWPEFVDRYRDELSARADLVHALAALTREGAVTLLFSSKEEEQNNAAVLRDYLRQYIDAAP